MDLGGRFHYDMVDLVRETRDLMNLNSGDEMAFFFLEGARQSFRRELSHKLLRFH